MTVCLNKAYTNSGADPGPLDGHERFVNAGADVVLGYGALYKGSDIVGEPATALLQRPKSTLFSCVSPASATDETAMIYP